MYNQIINDEKSKVFVFEYDVNAVYEIQMELYENGEYKDSLIEIPNKFNAPSIPIELDFNKPRSNKKKKIIKIYLLNNVKENFILHLIIKIAHSTHLHLMILTFTSFM